MDINTTQTRAINVQFGISLTILIRLVIVKTLISLVNFYVVKADTPFLLYLIDIDRLQVYYNNVIDTLISPITTLGSKHITLPIIRRFRHPFLIQGETLRTYIQESFNYNPYYLTSTKIYRLYRYFGYLLAEKLYRVLKRSRHDNVNRKVIDYLTKYYSLYQKYGRSLGRFKFTLYKDLNFNHLVYIDIIYINGSLVLYIINEVTYY